MEEQIIKLGKKSNPEKVKIGELITSDQVLNAEMRMAHAKKWDGIRWVDGYFIGAFGTAFDTGLMKHWIRPGSAPRYLVVDFYREFDTAVTRYDTWLNHN